MNSPYSKNTSRCIVIGASHAAVQLITSLRQHGWEDEILVITDEPFLPYQKPPLSKAYLSNQITSEKLAIRAEAFYQRLNIQFLLNHRVIGIDRENSQVKLENHEAIHYSKLALCTGARARLLEIEGHELAGIHYLRTATDVKDIQSSIECSKKVTIVGGGYIGLETAASLHKLGLSVCLLENEDRLLKRVASPELSEFFLNLHKEAGIDIRLNCSAKAFIGDQKVSKILCSDGSHIETDTAIVGIGVLPNIELAQSAGLEVNNGIVVNQYAQTSDRNIVAAGDCTMHPNRVLGTELRLESVPNATEQAKSAAASICGIQKEYAELPWFWSDQFNVKLQIVGINQGYDQIVVRGDLNQKENLVLFYLKEGILIAADCINSPKGFMACRKLIPMDIPIKPEDLPTF